MTRLLIAYSLVILILNWVCFDLLHPFLGGIFLGIFGFIFTHFYMPED